jgi:hypothetical protein
MVGCATGNNPGTGGSSTITTAPGGGGTGGTTGSTSTTGTSSTSTVTTTDTTTWPCGTDCSKFKTGACLKSVCNEGQYLGPIGVCTVVYDDPGVPCDDGAYCTTEDTCDGAGKCVGGPANDCGMIPGECQQVYCDELTKSCGTEPADNGTSCNAVNDLCQINGACQNGKCVGEPRDCSFSPLAECNVVACNPATGECEGAPDTSKDGTKCTLGGDLCEVNKVCSNGTCGGVPKDCSGATVGCNVGVCDPASGSCLTQTVPVGGECFAGIDQCHVGVCDATAACVAKQADDGTPCNDNNLCTTGDVCTAGVCGGTAVTGCHMYLNGGFEDCASSGWTLTGEWQCGAPTSGPNAAHGGHGVIATQLAGKYSNNLSYSSCNATSPVIDLSQAVTPKLSFYAWIDTEGGTTYVTDGFNLKISVDGGTTYAIVNSVTPAYPDTAGSENAWGGHGSTWQKFSADLTPYIGHANVKLRFSFYSDTSSTYAGVYVDDLVVAEPDSVPLAITTAGLADAVADRPFSGALTRTGGSASAAWSVLGGTNASWLTINPTTGILSGTPTAADLGPVTVQVQVQELAVPVNVAIKTYNFDVVSAVYFESFEGTCPNGWALTGDWQCGAPTSGPYAAHSGVSLLATQLAGTYSDSMAYASCTATSPAIDLTAVATPKLSFWVWMDTELSTGGTLYDAFNLKISTDNGATFTQVNSVSPAYTGTSSSESAWGGHVSAWQRYTADLTAYGNHSVMLRFAFHSDSVSTYAGVYIDDLTIADH